MRIGINLNETIHVKLTTKGFNKYVEYKQDLHGVNAMKFVEDAANPEHPEKLEIMMWEFMNIFGPHLHGGVGPMTTGNTIEIEVELEAADTILNPTQMGSWDDKPTAEEKFHETLVKRLL